MSGRAPSDARASSASTGVAALRPWAPGAVLGILGDGQLGKMMAVAAARLGYRTHVLSATGEGPASQVATWVTRGALDDPEAVATFSRAVDVVTYESENIPLDPARALARERPLRPSAEVLARTRDRLQEKGFVRGLGLATAAFARVAAEADLDLALAAVGTPAVLKTTTLGYDGKGQRRIDEPEGLAPAWASLGSGVCILESFVPFVAELSVVVARGADGTTRPYPVVQNEHRDHVLHRTLAPAEVAPEVARNAEGIARRIAEAIGLVGVLAVELFLTEQGDLLVNELAPRPHNSGHWTIEGCATSQFEQHVRALFDLPLGPVGPVRPAVMENLLGDDVHRWSELVGEPGAVVHLYGKDEVRPGRKMGHVTRLRPA
ncbi:MAG TPA: 5-(carboxyamino)imidazole ribonucleotide synthase [Polyangiaceae bacterium LLY-WYZ-14_1]|nr:5-(carboxyamino)imidazole ribonucleotide synthase [Polyangiaceae bacterium LLY-WYZ-14_1]